MDFAVIVVSSALSDINYETMNSGNTMTLSVNPIVEKCLAKIANDVTTQVRDKLVAIVIAVLTREFEDFDGETVRRQIFAELESCPIAFALEKHVAAASKTPKTKVVELDADGNAVKKVRPSKEKAPKAAKEPKAPKAPKVVLTEEEREALKATKQAEREAAKEARKAERAATKDADKEAAKEAAKAEKAAAKEAAKEARKAERDAAKEARKAEKEAAKLAKPAKEQRLPIPWCGKRVEGRCEALRAYHGLFAQCTADATEISAFCPSCEKSGAPFGTCAMRLNAGIFDYVAPNGKKCVRLANVLEKFGHKTEQFFQEEAAEHNITIPYEHLEKEVKQRGRPKSLSPRATKGKGKVATTDTTPASSRTASDADNSDTETENDEPVAAKKAPKAAASEKKQQARKKVEKTAAAAADAEAPKKRGRPAKAKEPVIEVNESLIQDLVSSASGRASDAAASSAELVEEDITPMSAVAIAPAAPKKVSALKKKTTRATEVVNGMTLWVEFFEGNKIWVNPSDMTVYDASNGEGVGTWDDAAKTIIFEEDEEDAEIEQFSEEED